MRSKGLFFNRCYIAYIANRARNFVKKPTLRSFIARYCLCLSIRSTPTKRISNFSFVNWNALAKARLHHSIYRRQVRSQSRTGSWSRMLYEDRTSRWSGSFQQSRTEDIYKYVFNSERKGDIEVLCALPTTRNCIQTQNICRAFALIKIGQTTEWLKDFLAGTSSSKVLKMKVFLLIWMMKIAKSIC